MHWETASFEQGQHCTPYVVTVHTHLGDARPPNCPGVPGCPQGHIWCANTKGFSVCQLVQQRRLGLERDA